MRWKITHKKIQTEGTMFLFSPRTCEMCLTCFFLERVPAIWSSWWSPRCPIDGGYLFHNKKSAIEEFNKNK